MTYRNLPTEVPIEIWERAIDHLWAEFEALKACTLVSRRWYPRSRLHLLGRVMLNDRNQVSRLAKVVRTSFFHAEAVGIVIIRGGQGRHDRKAIPHLGTFAAMLARKLTHLETLSIWYAVWNPSLMHADVLLHLHAFSSITWLTLNEVSFPSLQVFGQLLYSLPSLHALGCINVTFTRHTYDATFFQRLISRKLRRLNVAGDSMGDLIRFCISTTIAASFHEVWLGYAQEIHIRDMNTFAIQPLLQAARASLRELEITVIGYDLILVEPTAAAHLDDVHYSSLEVLTLRTQLRKRTDYTWIYTFLSRIFSGKLHTINLMFDVRHQHHEAILDEILEAFDSNTYSLIDDLLTTSRFKSLQIVTFQARGATDGAMPDQRQWLERLSLRLPHLHTQGVLRTCAWIPDTY